MATKKQQFRINQAKSNYKGCKKVDEDSSMSLLQLGESDGGEMYVLLFWILIGMRMRF